MAAEYLAAGTTATQTADITLATGVRQSYILTGSGRIALQYKKADGSYRTYVTMNDNRHFVQVTGPVTIRFNRPAQAVAVGIDREV